MKYTKTALLLPASLVSCIVALFLVGCLTDGEKKPYPGITFEVQDGSGRAFLSSVTWSYVADTMVITSKSMHGEDTATRDAVPLNSQHTLWGIHEAGIHGTIYLRVAYRRFYSLEKDVYNKPGECYGSHRLAVNADTLPKKHSLIVVPSPSDECRD
jgi:hypothetical protein